MKNATKCFAMLALVGSGFAAFACGGGDSAGGGATTPTASTSATAPADTSTATATASSTAPVASTAPVVPAPALVVVAMKLSIPKAKPIEIKDDGTVLVEGKQVAKFVGADLQDKDGNAMLGVAADGSLTSPSPHGDAKFNAKDELEIGGGKVFVGDDGVIKLTKPDGTADKDSGKSKFTGFKPTARRAATVLAIAMITATATVTATGSSATVAPAKK